MSDCLQIHFARGPDESDQHRLREKISSIEAVYVDILHCTGIIIFEHVSVDLSPCIKDMLDQVLR